MIPILEDIIRGLLDGTMSPEQARAYLAMHEESQREREAEGEDEFNEQEARADIERVLGADFDEALFDMHRRDDSAGVTIYVMKKLIAAGL